jgi:AbrB family looped-hinge helix DNA binding protein
MLLPDRKSRPPTPYQERIGIRSILASSKKSHESTRIAGFLIFRIFDSMTTTMEMGPRGAITLPKKMRERFDLRDRSLISLEETPEGILIRPAVAFPIELYSDERLKEFQEENQESIAGYFDK